MTTQLKNQVKGPVIDEKHLGYDDGHLSVSNLIK